LYLYGMDKSIPYKSSFLNNLSSKYTQEFSLAVIRSKTLKQSIYCQGVCSSLRYSIYKVQFAFRRAVSLLILSQLFPFVKNFFHFSTNYFLSRFYVPPASRKPCVF